MKDETVVVVLLQRFHVADVHQFGSVEATFRCLATYRKCHKSINKLINKGLRKPIYSELITMRIK